MQSPDVAFEAFVEKVRVKFKLGRDQAFRIKVRDEDGDLITMGDADDWNMALATARKEMIEEGLMDEGSIGAVGEGGMGKMEVWVV